MQTRAVTFGLVPFEHTTIGSVVFTLDQFCDRDNASTDVQVCGEAYLDLHHCLLSAETDIGAVRRLYSHPQAFGQCELWLKSTLKGVERVDVSSTSHAAVLARSEPGAAAIASRIASNVHGLRVLARNIEEIPENTTRFFVLSSSAATPSAVDAYAASPADGPAEGEGEGEDEQVEQAGDEGAGQHRALPALFDRTLPGAGQDKTLLSFTADYKQPGALCDGLKVFKDFGLNLTSICSRPSGKMPWNYIFFVEFEGHARTDIVQTALEVLGKYCSEVRVLGSYINRQPRRRTKPAAAA